MKELAFQPLTTVLESKGKENKWKGVEVSFDWFSLACCTGSMESNLIKCLLVVKKATTKLLVISLFLNTMQEIYKIGRFISL